MSPEPDPPEELCVKLRTAADRLLAGTPLHSSGKLTILDLAEEAQVRRWLLTHKYPNKLSTLWQRESLFDEQGLLRVRGMLAAG